MIKFIHAADVHLDSPLRGLERHDSAPVDAIRGATRRAFENLVELAIAKRVAFVLLDGDLFDGNWNDFRTAIFLARELGRLGEHNIKVFFVAGNHDAESKITKALEKPANMMVFPSRKPHSEVLKDLEVAIHGQSFAGQHIDENLAAGFPTALPGMFNKRPKPAV